jgi:LCP family protein required for cell wall assembly
VSKNEPTSFERISESMGNHHPRHIGRQPLPRPARMLGQPQPGEAFARRRRKTLVICVAVAFLLALGSAVSFAAFKYSSVYTLLKSSTSQPLPLVHHAGPQGAALPDDLSSVDHFNLLLLGSDNDAKFQSGAVLTQTDMVVRVDLASQKVTMVSIPRDMWLTTDSGVCCHKLDEISNVETDNASNALDKKLHGFAHTAATIEADFGIPINAYAWVGLDGFVKVIDTLGGVDVDVLHPIVDDAYPKDMSNNNPFDYQRLYISAGPQHLDGQTALNYVRSRHSDLLGDFGRAARQQSVLVALKRKLNDSSILGNLDQLAADLQGSVLTSLTISQVVQLANFTRGLQSSNFHQYVLGVPTYGYYDHAEGKSVVQPIWSAINRTMRQIFTSG